MLRSAWRKVGQAAGLLGIAAVAACNGDSGQEPDLAQVRVTMQQTADAQQAVVAPSAAGRADALRLSLDDVATLSVTVTQIRFLASGGDEEDNGAWVTLALSTPVTLDLLALPTTDASPVVIASGAVAVGSYQQVRLFVDGARITFANDLILGPTTFEAGVEYDVTIPSVGETGIKTDAGFDVSADAEGNVNDVPLVFDPTATFLNATVTGAGSVILAPVIRSSPTTG
jgi:hypothetical protein